MVPLLMITGSFPPDVCGVGDYTRNILGTETAKTWKLFYEKNWKISNFRKIISSINKLNYLKLVLQYPAQGYGWSLVPHLICIYYSWFKRQDFTVVLHEYSQLSFKARIASKIFLLASKSIIFTNEFELKKASKFWRRIEEKSRVVRISSNIPASPIYNPFDCRSIDVAYFGHIRPKKGIEQYLELVRLLRKNGEALRFAIFGQVPVGFESFAQAIVAECRAFDVDVTIGADSESIASLLSDTRIVYLPYPDGISERRGTAFAAMLNGAVVVTTVGEFTTREIASCTQSVSSPFMAAKVIVDLLDPTSLIAKEIQARAKMYVEMNFSNNWEQVAKSYLDL